MNPATLKLVITKVPDEILASCVGNDTAPLAAGELEERIALALTIWERLRVNSCNCSNVTSLDSEHVWMIPGYLGQDGGSAFRPVDGCPMHGEGPWTVARAGRTL